ncbi:MAG TPA: AMP-binding protein [Rhizomicrobium sp.]|jgi:2-aminobenzoate-CoA ligase|nr:AMP-binding protein [Rhizomicrobium sp.]
MQTAHLDRFVIDRLPPAGMLPEFLFDRPEFQYPERFNAGVELIDRAVASGLGARTAVIFPGGNWNYAELARASNQIAAVLVEDYKLQPGARVLLRGVNGPMLCALWLGVLKAGAIVVVTMPLLRSRELSYVIDKSRIDLSICEVGLLDEMNAAAGQAGGRVASYSCDGRSIETEIERRMKQKPGQFASVETWATDPALLAFTSGTTGQPKATVHFHRDLLAIADAFPRSILHTNADDLFLCSAPMAFTFGLGGHLVFPLRYGAASLLLPGRTPDELLDAMVEYCPSIVMTAPTAYRVMTERSARENLSHVRHYVSAGEHLPAPILGSWEAATGQGIVNGLGSTEMLHIFLSSPLPEAKPGGTGKVVPGYVAAVVDEDCNPVRPGEIGRLAVKGPTGCRYLDDPRQANYVSHGWNITGDACQMDEDGCFWFHSRTDDMIVSAGYNISGFEVEEALLRHPAIQECAVIAAPDTARGHIVKAFVVLKPEHAGSPELARAIQDFVKNDIAPFKYPRAIEYLDALPRNASGKVQRYLLRERGTATQ